MHCSEYRIHRIYSILPIDGPFRAAVPSGASTGIYEAVELRDGIKSQWAGQGVTKAVAHVNQILGPKLIESKISLESQAEIDAFLKGLDGTENKGYQFSRSFLIDRLQENTEQMPFWECPWHVPLLQPIKR